MLQHSVGEVARSRAMEKHAACAAPISPSGVLPTLPSNREANEYSPSTPSERNDPPLPLRPPRQTACACCLIMSVPSLSGTNLCISTA
jgi:hypothetical protein